MQLRFSQGRSGFLVGKTGSTARAESGEIAGWLLVHEMRNDSGWDGE